MLSNMTIAPNTNMNFPEFDEDSIFIFTKGFSPMAKIPYELILL